MHAQPINGKAKIIRPKNQGARLASEWLSPTKMRSALFSFGGEFCPEDGFLTKTKRHPKTRHPPSNDPTQHKQTGANPTRIAPAKSILAKNSAKIANHVVRRSSSLSRCLFSIPFIHPILARTVTAPSAKIDLSFFGIFWKYRGV